MRLVLTISLLACAVSAAVAEPALPIKPVHGSTKEFRDRQEQMEDKSKAALTDQETRNARFDDRVRRATGSVCSGCFAEPTGRTRAHKQKAASHSRDDPE